MRPPDDDPEASNAPTDETTEESDASAATAARPTAPLPPSAIPAPTLRFLLHKDTPLWRFGH